MRAIRKLRGRSKDRRDRQAALRQATAEVHSNWSGRIQLQALTAEMKAVRAGIMEAEPDVGGLLSKLRPQLRDVSCAAGSKAYETSRQDVDELVKLLPQLIAMTGQTAKPSPYLARVLAQLACAVCALLYKSLTQARAARAAKSHDFHDLSELWEHEVKASLKLVQATPSPMQTAIEFQLAVLQLGVPAIRDPSVARKAFEQLSQLISAAWSKDVYKVISSAFSLGEMALKMKKRR